MSPKRINISDKSTGEKTTESIIWFTTIPIIMQIIRFGNSILLARILTPRDFGIIGIASVIVFYCNNLSNFGLGNAIVQRKTITKNHIDSFFSFNLTISIFLFILFFLLSGKISIYFDIEELNPVIKLFSIMFIITSFHTIGYTKLRRGLNFKAIAINDAIKTISSMTISLSLALLGYDYWSLLIALIASNVISAILINIKAQYFPRLSFNTKSIKDLINYASWSFISVQIRLLSQYADKLIIGKMLGPINLGFYEKSSGISSMPNEHFSNKLGSIAFSIFSSYQDDNEKLKYYFLKTFTSSMFIITPLHLGLFAVSDLFVSSLLGEKWLPMIPPFKLLIIAFLVTSITSLISTLNLTCGNYKKEIRARGVCLVGLIPALLFAAKISLAAVAFTILIHNVIFFLCAFYILKSTVKIDLAEIIKCVYPAFIGSILMLIIIKLIEIFVMQHKGVLNFFILILIGFIVYFLWFFFTNFKQWIFLKKKIKNYKKKLYIKIKS